MKTVTIHHVAVAVAILLHGALLSLRMTATDPVVAPVPLQAIKVRLQNTPPLMPAAPAEPMRSPPPPPRARPQPREKPAPTAKPEPLPEQKPARNPEPLPEPKTETRMESPAAPQLPTVADAAVVDAAPLPESKTVSRPQEAPSRAVSPDWQANYLAALSERLERHKIYPVAARRLGLDGESLVQLRLDDTGRAVSVRIVRGTGHRMLDDAILRMVANAQPFPAPRIPRGEIFECVVPVRFSLQR